MSEEKKVQVQAEKAPDMNQILKVRREKLKNLQDAGMDPFVETKFVVSTHAQEVKDDFDALQECHGETVFDVYRVAAFGQWVNEFIAAIEALTLRPSAKQMAQSSGCKPLTFEESVYFFTRSYFGLKDFNSVRDLTVADYIMAKKDDYNHNVFERNIANAIKAKE